MSVTVFGVRHHGPGSARSLARALETLQPDAVLVGLLPAALTQPPHRRRVLAELTPGARRPERLARTRDAASGARPNTCCAVHVVTE